MEIKIFSMRFFILMGYALCLAQDLRYFPTWESIDSRPLPGWYDDSKVGIFIHWGVYSVPGIHSEWFWWDWKGEVEDNDVKSYMNKFYSPTFKYADFASNFKALFFDPVKWAKIFNSSGANYVVITSKHHEGFTMYPSNYSWNWNSFDTGPKRDIVGELAEAIRNNTQMKFGLYYSLFEWFHPLYLSDKQSNFTTKKYVETISAPQIKEIVETYLPEVLWLDGDVGPPEYWGSLDTLTWLYNDSPVKNTVVTNDRWGTGCPCHHGGYFTCQDKFLPNELQPRKWENCMTLDRSSWGFRKNMDISDVLSLQELLLTLIKTVSFGGNILINVGPTQDGVIPPIFEERLLQLGKWLSINGEAIYHTKPYLIQKEPFQDIWYTTKKAAESSDETQPPIFAIFRDWPDYNNGYFVELTGLVPSFPTKSDGNEDISFDVQPLDNWNVEKNNIKVTLLGYNTPEGLPWKYKNMTKEQHTFTVDLSDVMLPLVLGNGPWALKIQYTQQKTTSVSPIRIPNTETNDNIPNHVH